MLTAARRAPPLAPADASREMGDSWAVSGAARAAAQRAAREKWRITFFPLKRPLASVAAADLTGADLYAFGSPRQACETARAARVTRRRSLAVGGVGMLGLDRALEVVVGDACHRRITRGSGGEHGGFGSQQVRRHVPRDREELPVPTVIAGGSRCHAHHALLPSCGARGEPVEIVDPCLRIARRRH